MIISRIIRVLVGVSALLGFAAAASLIAPAQVAESNSNTSAVFSQIIKYSTPTEAHAGTNMGRVRNYAGEPVRVWCDYGSNNSYNLIEKYGTNPKANSTYFCDSLGGDTDQFGSQYDKRCMHYTGPGYADGWYKLNPHIRYKVAGLALVKVYPWGGTGTHCGGRPYFNYSPEKWSN